MDDAKRRKLVIIGGSAAAALLVGVLAGVLAGNRGESEPGLDNVAAVSTSMPSSSFTQQTRTAESSNESSGDSGTVQDDRQGAELPPITTRYDIQHQESGFGGTFGSAATLTDATSEPFMRAVANAYANSGAAGGSTVLDGVYSPVTGRSYVMTCDKQSDGAVVCSGGNNARVLLFN